jgi:hypothetical protein
MSKTKKSKEDPKDVATFTQEEARILRNVAAWVAPRFREVMLKGEKPIE